MGGFNHVSPTNDALVYRDHLHSGDKCMINVCFDADIVHSLLFSRFIIHKGYDTNQPDEKKYI